MPIYVYECSDCLNTSEELQRVSDPPLVTCSVCGGHLHKKFSPEIGLSFKGSGFYITDYKNNKPEKKKDAASVAKAGTA